MQAIRVEVETEHGDARGTLYRGMLVGGLTGDMLAEADDPPEAERQGRPPALHYQSVAEFAGEMAILEALSPDPND